MCLGANFGHRHRVLKHLSTETGFKIDFVHRFVGGGRTKLGHNNLPGCFPTSVIEFMSMGEAAWDAFSRGSEIPRSESATAAVQRPGHATLADSATIFQPEKLPALVAWAGCCPPTTTCRAGAYHSPN